MIISFHGGMCCGIKHIYDMGNPDTMCSPITATKKRLYHDVNYTYSRQDLNFFTDEAPAETKLQRLDRYLAFLRDRRPGGIVEIVLVAQDDWYWKYSLWEPLLLERGFVKVGPEVFNSNSDNKIQVFHLIMEDDLSFRFCNRGRFV